MRSPAFVAGTMSFAGWSLRGAAVPVYQTGVQIGSVLMLPLVAGLATLTDGYRAPLLATSLVAAVGVAASVGGLREAS